MCRIARIATRSDGFCDDQRAGGRETLLFSQRRKGVNCKRHIFVGANERDPDETNNEDNKLLKALPKRNARPTD